MPLSLGTKAKTDELTCDLLRVKHIQQDDTDNENTTCDLTTSHSVITQQIIRAG